MREFLKRLIAAKEKRAAELRKLIKGTQNVDECRALGETLEAVLEELAEAKRQLEDLGDDDGEGNGEGGNEGGQQAQEGRSANPMHAFRQVAQYGQQTRQAADHTDSVEYRTAFMNFVCRGVPIPMELRESADAVTMTADAGAAIPTTILNEIVKQLGVYGEIYAKVRKLNVQGGVKIPVLSIKPIATWITADTATSESGKQNLQAKQAIVFNYYGLECKVAQTLLVNVTTLDAFQDLFVKLAAEAMVQAMEYAIINGTGEGMPQGIVSAGGVTQVEMTAEEFASWSAWMKKIFGKMRKAYRNGSFIMAQGTFDGYINGMVDQLGQPIGRVNYGITDGETYRFGGKEVITVEEDILPSWDNAENGDPVAIFGKLSDYAINSNMQMQAVKWVDHDTNEIKNKCILICDGKVVDPFGFIVIRKAGSDT